MNFPPIAIAWLAISVVVYVYLELRPAPYGRHGKPGFGPMISARAGWVLMELPAVLTIAICFVQNEPQGLVGAVFLALWEFHYVYRTFVFPLRMSKTSRPMPLLIALSGVAFNIANGAFIGTSLFASAQPNEWLTSPQFITGLGLFALGFGIHTHADNALLRLRSGGQTGYKIPYGGLYKTISCPNYFGEIVQWTGFAILSNSLAAFAFVIWTMANLVPRARAHHKWYRSTFPEYPKERRAIFPYVM